MESWKMWRIKNILTFLLCVTLLGCRDSKEIALEKAIKNLEQDIDHFGKTMENEVINPGIPNAELTERINAMPDERTRQKLRERLAEYVYSIELLKVPLDKYDRRGWFKGYVRDFTNSGMFSKCALTFSETWRLRFRYLEWLRRQVENVCAKRPYPDGVFVRMTPSGQFSWRSERGKSKVELDYCMWLDTYNRDAMSFEQTVSWWEGKLLRTERAYTDPTELDEVTAQFEKLVGRKLRTMKQCEDDLNADKRYFYPIYVATPEGIKEAWSTAEADNMTKVTSPDGERRR